MFTHLRLLRKLLTTLQFNGLTLKFSKCTFAEPEINVLGHFVSGNGIRADQNKTEPICKALHHKKCSEVRSFLGFTNYCSRYIPAISSAPTLAHYDLHTAARLIVDALPWAEYRTKLWGHFAVQLGAVYLIIFLAAVCHIVSPFGHTMQFIGCQYGNHMRNKIYVTRKKSKKWPYFMFFILFLG